MRPVHHFLALALVFLLALPSGFADEGKLEKEHGTDDADDSDDRKSDGERKLVLDVDSGKATIKLEREAAGVEDAVKIEYDARSAKLQVKHEEKSGESKEEQKLEARFLAVVEFVDSNGDGAYDASERVASAWALGDKDSGIRTNGTASWGAITVTDTSAGSASGKKLSARATLGPNGTFGLDLYVFGDFAMVGNASLQPTEVKIDILLEDYPFVRNDTALAVVADLKAKAEFKDKDESDEDGLAAGSSAGNETLMLTFTWLETAVVDGVERDVKTTVLRSKAEAEDGKEEHKARLAFAYGRGESILHDPTMGIHYASAGDSSGAPGPGAAIVVAVLALAVVSRRRNRQ